MVLDSAAAYGELVPEVVSGIRIERWQRTVGSSQVRESTNHSSWQFDCFLSLVMSNDNSIKASHAVSPAPAVAAKKPFGEVLKQQPKPVAGAARPALTTAAHTQKPPPLPKQAPKTTVGTVTGIRTANATTATSPYVASAENLSAARAGMNAEAGRLSDVRAESHANAEQKVDARVLDLIVKELATELNEGAPQTAPKFSTGSHGDASTLKAIAPSSDAAGQTAHADSAAKVDPNVAATAKAKAAAALVEKIETFVKSNRPALAVTLGGAINARVEVERTGPGEVSLRVQGTKGPPPAEDLARIRDAVKARGLKLSSLSVG